jgi:predicted ArsR family transcriptional regulator
MQRVVGCSRRPGQQAARETVREQRVADVLECLRKYGQRLDLEIAKETGVPLATVRRELTGLAASGAVVLCTLTRFERGTRIDAWQCRVSGYVPPPAPGRRAKPAA